MKTVVLGIGNVLMGDEGVGVRTIERLRGICLPHGVSLLDGGTRFTGFEKEIEGIDKLVVVDATLGGDAPGTVYRFGIEELEDEKGPVKWSAHDLGFAAKLRLMGAAGTRPREVVVIGVEPAVIAVNEGLSEQVAATMPRIIDAVLAEIGVADN